MQPRSALRNPLLIAAVLAAAIILWGGYVQHWSWAGINGRTATLWDWLHLVLLPVAVAILPLWMSQRTRLRRSHKVAGLALLALFALVTVAGYSVPWRWTGFVGNRLWDWLELLALPVAVALTPVYAELRARWCRRYSVVAALLLAGFVGVAVGGYMGKWSWTGFRGNTAWDWLHLLLLPLLIPVVLVPAVMPMAQAGVTFVDEP